MTWVFGLSLLLMVVPSLAHGGGGRAYVMGGSTNTISIVDVDTGTALGSIAVGARPFDIGVTPDGSRAYVANIDAGTVSVVDTATDAVVATVPVGMYPTSIAVSPDGSRIYVACGGWLVVVIDAATNTVVQEMSGYLGYLTDVAVGPDGSRLYLAENFTNHYGPMLGSVAIADAATGAVLTRISVYDPSDITLNADGTRAYVVNNRGGFSVIDLTSMTVQGTVDEGYALFGGLALSPDGDRIYIADRVAGTLSVIDGTTSEVLARIAVGSEPTHVAFSSDGARVFVSNAKSGSVSIVDTATNTVVGTVVLGGRPGAIALVPASPVPVRKEQCKRGGWRAYPQFRNEGACVSWVALT